MSKFSLSESAARVAEALGIAKDALEAKLEQIARDYPDAGARVAQIEAYLQSVTPADVAQNLVGSLQGFASDLQAGIAKVDPGAWQGVG